MLISSLSQFNNRFIPVYNFSFNQISRGQWYIIVGKGLCIKSSIDDRYRLQLIEKRYRLQLCFGLVLHGAVTQKQPFCYY